MDGLIGEGAQVLYAKVDVEGHEPAVFRGMSRLIRTASIHVIVWEHSPQYYGKDDEAPAVTLKRHGYWISKLHHAGAQNYVAVGPKADADLRQSIKAMGATNLADVAAQRGVDAFARYHQHHGLGVKSKE